MLATGRVLAAVRDRPWKGKPRDHVDLAAVPGEADSPQWKGALGVLEPVLHEQRRGTHVHVTLSNSLVRYALVPSQPRLSRSGDEAYVRDFFTQLYGEAAAGWDIRAASAPGPMRVGSAIDGELVAGLAAACGQAGVKLASLRPLFPVVVNRWRREMRSRCFWLVLSEPGVLCLALAERRHWRALRTARVGADWLQGLAPLLVRETLLSGLQADVGMVYVWAPQLAAETLAGAGPLPITRLAGDVLVGVGQ